MRIVLSLPGGGIRGLTQAVYLRHVERLLRGPIRDRLDLIAGTSTGGILAIGLGAGLSTDELVELYRDRGGRIFRRSRWHQVRTAWGVRGPRYPADGLDGVLREVLGDRELSELRPRVMVTAHRLDSEGLVDGGVHALDPTDCALAEAVRLWPGEPIVLLTVHNQPEGLSKSVFFKSWREDKWSGWPAAGAAYATAAAPTFFPPGDGRGPSSGEASGWGLLDWGRAFPSMALEGSADSVDYRVRRFMSLMPAGRYIRIQPDREAGEMDDVSREHLTLLEDLGLEMAETHARETAYWIAAMDVRGAA